MLTRILPHGSVARNALRRQVFRSLCLVSGVMHRTNARQVLPAGSNVSRIFGGDLRGLLLAHPLNHTSPSFALGLFEGHVAETIYRYVEPGATCYDVGANVGYHALRMAKAAGPTGRVFAFEPSPNDNAILRWNVEVNRFSNVEVIDAAVARTPGTSTFATFAEPGVHHIATDKTPADANLIQVRAVSLDNLVNEKTLPPPSFVKIDVEGGELSALEGATHVLETVRPIVIAEVWSATRGEVERLMKGHRYASRELSNHGGVSDILFTP